MAGIRWLIVGFMIALAVFFVGGYILITEGGVPMAASAAPLPLEATVAHLALRASDSKDRDIKDPLPVTDDNLAAGATTYHDHCAVCHGVPVRPSELQEAMFPVPPQLFDPHQMVTDDPEGITYWKVTNGIRLSGMPGFEKLLSESQRWQVTMLVAHADKLSDRARAALSPTAVK
jgi:mono/diheme cytochrome c family protein